MQEALRLVDEDLPESGQKPGSRMTRLLNNKKLKPLIFKDKSPDHFLPIKARWQGRMINGHNARGYMAILGLAVKLRISRK